MNTAIWLTICATAAQVPALKLPPPEIGIATPIPALPADLPDPRFSPKDGRWIDKADLDGALTDPDGVLIIDKPRWIEGTFLPIPLDDVVLRRLRMLDNYPDLCQVNLNEMAIMHKGELDGLKKLGEAQCHTVAVSSGLATVDPGYLTPTILVMAFAGSFVIGVLAGYGVARVIH